jgi:hypothetical protein
VLPDLERKHVKITGRIEMYKAKRAAKRFKAGSDKGTLHSLNETSKINPDI